MGICAPTVIVVGLPAARLSDFGGCPQPPAPLPVPDPILKGSATVIISCLPAARIGDNCLHGGAVALGAPNVITGG
jgi:uncharacterized Zn-binding protein involved in type VI secretion